MSEDQAIYETSPVKRKRRSKASMTELMFAVRSVIERAGEPMTIRHLFYRLSGVGVIEKSENAYRNLCAHLSKWRKDGLVPFSAFVDSTRWYYGSTGFDDIEDALIECASLYRKNYWGKSPYHLEVWTEKETIASLLQKACHPFGIQIFVCRGFASLSSLYSCAKGWKPYIEQGKQVHVLYFGDHDPSGLRIDQTAADTIRDQFNVAVNFERVAVTRDQILEYDLPTRPTKKGSTHSAGFEGDSVEIDAFDPRTLKELVEVSVERFMDPHELQLLKTAEAEEREHLLNLATKGGGL